MKVLKWLDDNIEKFIGTAFASVMLISLFVQVLARYVFKASTPWTEELALICFIGSVYFGAAYATKIRGHITIELLVSRFDKRTQHIFKIVNNVFFFLFACWIMPGFIMVISNIHKYGSTLIATGIPKFLLYSMMPTAFFLIIIRLIQDTVKHVREIKEIDEAKKREINS